MAQLLATSKTAAHKVKAVEVAPDRGAELPTASMPAPADREQAIREAAYALFEARGGEPGHELDDWLQAEAELQRMTSTSSDAAKQVAH